MLHHTYFRVCNGAELSLGKNVCIKNSRIIVTPGSSIRIGNGVVIENAEISVVDGSVSIGEYVRIGHTKDSTLINVECGRMRVDHHTKIAARRVWIRFGGDLSIGCYTNINSNSEIRCDERISIGNFNQISYEVNIWDTNTHNILPNIIRKTKRFAIPERAVYFLKTKRTAGGTPPPQNIFDRLTPVFT